LAGASRTVSASAALEVAARACLHHLDAPSSFDDENFGKSTFSMDAIKFIRAFMFTHDPGKITYS
jgi:hypothetical protein